MSNLTLVLDFPEHTQFDRETEEFNTLPSVRLVLMHNLLSVVRWESKWKRSFVDRPPSSVEEVLDYVDCMAEGQVPVPALMERLTRDHAEAIKTYIADSMSASVMLSRPGQQKSSEKMTSDLIYYYMVTFQIPFEAEEWHLNRLLMLIRICNAKQSSGQKTNPKSAASQRAALNRARRARVGSRG